MILAINGSYRQGGFSDRVVAAFEAEFAQMGEAFKVIHLRDYPINFCLNCRECTLTAGAKPAACVQQDGMAALVDDIEAATGFVLMSPTNTGTVTAVFKRFMERLVVYAYWPWDAPAPKPRQSRQHKKAVLVTSSAAPALMARVGFSTVSALKQTAKIIGAKPVGVIEKGFMAKPIQDTALSDKTLKAIKAKAKILAST